MSDKIQIDNFQFQEITSQLAILAGFLEQISNQLDVIIKDHDNEARSEAHANSAEVDSQSTYQD